MDFTTNASDFKRLVREYYEQLYTKTFNNLDDMTNSLTDTNYQNLLSQEELDNANSTTSILKFYLTVLKPSNKERAKARRLHWLTLLNI